MRNTAGSFRVQRAGDARNAAGVLCCVISFALLALTACIAVAAKAAANPLPSPISMPAGIGDTRRELSVHMPDDWNGRVAMLLRGAVPDKSASAPPGPNGSAASALLQRGFAVVTPAALAGRVTGMTASGERLYIHFLVGFGSPTSTHFVGMSLGEYVGLATTIGKTAGEFDRALAYAPGGFVHAASPELRDTRTIELALHAEESVAALLSYRLGIDRRNLATTLAFYCALLTGVRDEPGHRSNRENSLARPSS
jgi:hypothetical protein